MNWVLKFKKTIDKADTINMEEKGTYLLSQVYDPLTSYSIKGLFLVKDWFLNKEKTDGHSDEVSWPSENLILMRVNTGFVTCIYLFKDKIRSQKLLVDSDVKEKLLSFQSSILTKKKKKKVLI